MPTTTIVDTNGGKRSWRRKVVLHKVLEYFIERERKIFKEDGIKSKRYKYLLEVIRQDREENPGPHRLGEQREALFDRAIKQLTGRHLRGKIFVGCIAHELTYVDVMERIDRSIVVIDVDAMRHISHSTKMFELGDKICLYHVNITGHSWIKRHSRVKHTENFKVVPIRTARERDGQPEEVSIEQIKRCVLEFIDSN